MNEKIYTQKLLREVIEEKCRVTHRLRNRDFARTEVGKYLCGIYARAVGTWLKLDTRDLKVELSLNTLSDARDATNN